MSSTAVLTSPIASPMASDKLKGKLFKLCEAGSCETVRAAKSICLRCVRACVGAPIGLRVRACVPDRRRNRSVKGETTTKGRQRRRQSIAQRGEGVRCFCVSVVQNARLCVCMRYCVCFACALMRDCTLSSCRFFASSLSSSSSHAARTHDRSPSRSSIDEQLVHFGRRRVAD